MENTIVASQSGGGGPYIIVPQQFVRSLYFFIQRAGVECSGPRDPDADPSVCDTPQTPLEMESTIAAWFDSGGYSFETVREGDSFDPLTIRFKFDPDRAERTRKDR